MTAVLAELVEAARVLAPQQQLQEQRIEAAVAVARAMMGLIEQGKPEDLASSSSGTSVRHEPPEARSRRQAATPSTPSRAAARSARRSRH